MTGIRHCANIAPFLRTSVTSSSRILISLFLFFSVFLLRNYVPLCHHALASLCIFVLYFRNYTLTRFRSSKALHFRASKSLCHWAFVPPCPCASVITCLRSYVNIETCVSVPIAVSIVLVSPFLGTLSIPITSFQQSCHSQLSIQLSWKLRSWQPTITLYLSM